MTRAVSLAGGAGGAVEPPGWALDRVRQLDAPHVTPLNALVRGWRAQHPRRAVPWFDPADGGVGARVLLLLEAPGPRTLAPGGSGFCSEDNPDPTNTLLRDRRAAAGLPRSACVKWNALPWTTSGSTGGQPRAAEVAEAADALGAVLDLLPDVRVLLAFGAVALSVYGLASTSGARCHALPVLAVPHPSQRNTRARAQALQRIERALAHAARLAR